MPRGSNGAKKMESWFRDNFPNFVFQAHKVTSHPTETYNCIAWAFGRSDKWWWPDDHPDCYWPIDCSGMTEAEAFDALFVQDGWTITVDESFSEDRVKIALFVDGSGAPTHASRLISEGVWTSKLGSAWDVSHNRDELNGDSYGTIIRIYEKPI